jgi:hypothetical protein
LNGSFGSFGKNKEHSLGFSAISILNEKFSLLKWIKKKN